MLTTRNKRPNEVEWQPMTNVGGRYLIQRMIGKGSSGIVYMAGDLFLRKLVAVKALRPSVAQNASNVDQFRREVALAHSVTHPNIVRTHDLGEHSGVHFLSMSYIEGLSLKQQLAEANTLSANEVTRMALAVCSALAAAHAAKVVHRDLKPSNIMLVQDERRAVVLDFGIAGVYEDSDQPDRIAGEARWDATSSGYGSPQYMAPEQLRGEVCTPQTDLYSLGVIMFAALTGELPFEATNSYAYAQKSMTELPRRARSINPDVPRSVDETIAACLQTDPLNRPSSADALAKLLGPRRLGRWARRLSWAVSSLLAMLLLGWLLVGFAERAIIREMQPALARLAFIAAADIDPADLDVIHTEADIESAPFERVRQRIRSVREQNPEMQFIYVLRSLPEPDQWEFVVDPDPYGSETDIPSLPGQHYDGSDSPFMDLTNVTGQIQFDREFGHDEYGYTLSGYAPIGASRGQGGYILGVDATNSRLSVFRMLVVALCGATWLFLLFVPLMLLRLIKRMQGGPSHQLDYKPFSHTTSDRHGS